MKKRQPAAGRRKRRPGTRRAAVRPRRVAHGAEPIDLRGLPADEIEALRAELERSLVPSGDVRWNVDPADVQRSVARLVLTLMEFIRKLLERQAIRRMEAHTLTAEQVEAVGLALMRLEDTLKTMGDRFGLTAEDLNLDLGPLGRLM